MYKLTSDTFMKEEFPFWIQRTIQKTVPEHGHDFVELVHVVSGSGTHCFEGVRYCLQTGDVFIINPGETHSYSVETGGHLEIVNCLFLPSLIPDTLLRELDITSSMDYFYVHPFLSGELRFNHRLNVRGQDAACVLNLLDSMVKELEQSRTGYKTLIRMHLIELLVRLSRSYTLMHEQPASLPSREQLRRMTARRMYGYMERNCDKKLTLQSLAELFDVSTRQLNRLIRLEYGRSVIEVLHEIRIGRAKRLLLESEEKVNAIASMVGYDDPAFFSKLFHRLAGCSPSQYRRRNYYRYKHPILLERGNFAGAEGAD